MITRDKVRLSVMTGTPLIIDSTEYLKTRSFIVDMKNNFIRYGSPEDAEKCDAALRKLDSLFPTEVPAKVINSL